MAKSSKTKKQPVKKFHHVHLPHFSRWALSFVWTFSHLFLPPVVHYLTDKYKDRYHHLIVDTIYAAVGFMLVAANIGLGIWFYLYLTPAQIDTRVFTTSEVRSGQEMSVAVSYLNPHRAIKDVTIDVFLPEGFVLADKEGASPVHYELGELIELDSGLVDFEGIVYGSLDETYDLRVVTSYTYLNRRQYETTVHRFTITDAAFTVAMNFPPVVIYNVPVDGVVTYANTSSLDQQNVNISLTLPQNFTLTSASRDQQQLAYNGSTQTLNIGSVPAGGSGTILLRGIFKPPTNGGTVGDQLSEFGISASTDIFNSTAKESVTLFHGTQRTPVEIVAPRVRASITGTDVVNFGESIVANVRIENIGTNEVQNIITTARVSGEPVNIERVRMQHSANGTVERVTGAEIDNDALHAPAIQLLQPGEATIVTVTIPSAVIAGEEIRSMLFITGDAYSPELNSTVPIEPAQFETKFNSQVEFSGKAIYYGPDNEQIGYGPYPPRPWEVTSMRVVLSVSNLNNPLSNVHIRTTLPGQVEWTNLYSVSAGTHLSYTESDRSLEWVIPSLSPQQQAYGAQFEVRLTPNHLQIGQTPQLTQGMTISAQDSFTESTLYQTASAVELPVPIAE